jgi:tetratricopeptide (TPR) repeat protein
MIMRALLAALIFSLTLAGSRANADNEQSYSAEGLYNLANSYARAGKPAMAVLNYERASLLAPNDADIDANLRYLRESMRLPPETRNWFERAATVASPAVISWMGVLGLMVVGAALLAGRLSLRHRWLRRVGLFVGIGLMGLTVCNGVVLWPRLHEAVVITGATPVRVSPVPMGDSLFLLPEAETVRMAAEYEGFVLVKTRAGRTGWVSSASLAPVLPRK